MRLSHIVLAAVILGCLPLGRFHAAPQLAPSRTNEPSSVGPALTKPGARVAWLSGLNKLGGDRRENDFRFIAAGPDGAVWAVWTSYSGFYDEIRARWYVYEAKPDQQEVNIEYRDNNPQAGTSYYYARIEQADGQIAWASPIWVAR